jgi:hypothetical protein
MRSLDKGYKNGEESSNTKDIGKAFGMIDRQVQHSN